jgi:hypothetical protein
VGVAPVDLVLCPHRYFNPAGRAELYQNLVAGLYDVRGGERFVYKSPDDSLPAGIDNEVK